MGSCQVSNLVLWYHGHATHASIQVWKNQQTLSFHQKNTVELFSNLPWKCRNYKHPFQWEQPWVYGSSVGPGWKVEDSSKPGGLPGAHQRMWKDRRTARPKRKPISSLQDQVCCTYPHLSFTSSSRPAPEIVSEAPCWQRWCSQLWRCRWWTIQPVSFQSLGRKVLSSEGQPQEHSWFCCNRHCCPGNLQWNFKTLKISNTDRRTWFSLVLFRIKSGIPDPEFRIRNSGPEWIRWR